MAHGSCDVRTMRTGAKGGIDRCLQLRPWHADRRAGASGERDRSSAAAMGINAIADCSIVDLGVSPAQFP